MKHKENIITWCIAFAALMVIFFLLYEGFMQLLYSIGFFCTGVCISLVSRFIAKRFV